MEVKMRNLIPWGRSDRNIPARNYGDESSPFFSLHREMNRLFDDFFRDADFPGIGRRGGSWPQVEMRESDKDVTVVAELPGIEEKDVELSLQQNTLTLKGERKSESEGALYSERWHGQFQRTIQLSPDIDPEKATAVFKNGILTVTFAKRPEAQSTTKRIPIGK
ncbi:MAG: Hsp20/alpha crystallin family protein [Rhodospirillaceae bacterium]|nr:MAG: Hsp20/alpha crystallin family protein [Rhodospirillaceae bacterium]